MSGLWLRSLVALPESFCREWLHPATWSTGSIRPGLTSWKVQKVSFYEEKVQLGKITLITLTARGSYFERNIDYEEVGWSTGVIRFEDMRWSYRWKCFIRIFINWVWPLVKNLGIVAIADACALPIFWAIQPFFQFIKHESNFFISRKPFSFDIFSSHSKLKCIFLRYFGYSIILKKKINYFSGHS